MFLKTKEYSPKTIQIQTENQEPQKDDLDLHLLKEAVHILDLLHENDLILQSFQKNPMKNFWSGLYQ
jgi:hypothetical protein